MDFETLFGADIALNPENLVLAAQGPILGAEAIGEGPVRTKNYVEEVVPRYSPEEFFSHFRMTRNTFEQLLENVGHRIDIVSTVPVQKKLLFTVWMLAKPEAFQSSCDRFGFSKGTGHRIFQDIIRIIASMMDTEIRWPTINEGRVTAEYFLQKFGFPGVIGAIDGCHIAIKSPKNNPIDYYNRKSFHSMILQGVCNHEMVFTDIFVGMPGRVHDARVFHRSPLYEHLEQNDYIPANMHLVGDTAYPLLQSVMVPFRDNGHFTPHQNAYNTKLSKCRSKIEQAFGRLKCKWRRLKYLDMDLANIPYAITAACVLHNFTIRREGEIGVDDEVDVEHEQIQDEVYEEQGEVEAGYKRQMIMNNL